MYLCSHWPTVGSQSDVLSCFALLSCFCFCLSMLRRGEGWPTRCHSPRVSSRLWPLTPLTPPTLVWWIWWGTFCVIVVFSWSWGWVSQSESVRVTHSESVRVTQSRAKTRIKSSIHIESINPSIIAFCCYDCSLCCFVVTSSVSPTIHRCLLLSLLDRPSLLVAQVGSVLSLF